LKTEEPDMPEYSDLSNMLLPIDVALTPVKYNLYSNIKGKPGKLK
jgi:hypothetical protein